jgi:hypothetical protein
MEMFEILFACAAVIFVIFCVVLLAKLVLAVVLFPINLGLFLIKGLLVLLCIVPIVIVTIGLASLVPLMILAILGVPLLVVIGGVVLLVKLLS